MDTIGEQKLWSFAPQSNKAAATTCVEVRAAAGHKVISFMDLATKIAELQFLNREHVLLFRGQRSDYRNEAKLSSLKPGVFRSGVDKKPNIFEVRDRFARLETAEATLAEEYTNLKLLGVAQINRHRILRWAILQHYEICLTPLLDFTHSLRIAASFASQNAKNEAYVFVIGVPNLSGAVTASAEAGVQIIRLSSVCPPTAVRAHIQECYLLGEYPEMTSYRQQKQYHHHEIDFGRRLVAKFVFDPSTFWKNDEFPLLARSALYPDAVDPFYQTAERIKLMLAGTKIGPGEALF